jgi:hypothetical protein
MTVLREPVLWVEWSQGLRRQPEHCCLGHGLSHPLLRDRGVLRVSHDLTRGQALLVQRAGWSSTVEAPGDHTPPQRGQTRVLCRLVLHTSFMHVSEKSNAFLALYCSIQETFALECIMFA